MLRRMASRNNNPTSQGEPGAHSPEEPQDRALLQSEALWALAADLKLDVRERKFIWPDERRLTLQDSAERIRKDRPEVSSEQVVAFLIAFIENYAPEECTEQELDEIDRLAEEWLGELEDSDELER